MSESKSLWKIKKMKESFKNFPINYIFVTIDDGLSTDLEVINSLIVQRNSC